MVYSFSKTPVENTGWNISFINISVVIKLNKDIQTSTTMKKAIVIIAIVFQFGNYYHFQKNPGLKSEYR